MHILETDCMTDRPYVLYYCCRRRLCAAGLQKVKRDVCGNLNFCFLRKSARAIHGWHVDTSYAHLVRCKYLHA